MIYIDRGDPAAPDFVLGNLTVDNAWHDLDLSGIVPAAGANMKVYLRLDLYASEKKKMFLRHKGHANEINMALAQVTTAYHKDDTYYVVLDANRKIEYKLEVTMWGVVDITVRGWDEPC